MIKISRDRPLPAHGKGNWDRTGVIGVIRSLSVGESAFIPTSLKPGLGVHGIVGYLRRTMGYNLTARTDMVEDGVRGTVVWRLPHD